MSLVKWEWQTQGFKNSEKEFSFPLIGDEEM